MEKCVAERKLLYSLKGEKVSHEFSIRLGSPYRVTEGMMNFPVGEKGFWGCDILMTGLEENYSEKVYGADSLQSVELAIGAIGSIIRRLSKQYDIFYLSNEPYL